MVAAFEEAIARVHDEPGVDLYALHEGRDRLVMIEKYESEQARSEHARVWVTIRALVPTVRGSWPASAAVMLRSVATCARPGSPVLSRNPAATW